MPVKEAQEAVKRQIDTAIRLPEIDRSQARPVVQEVRLLRSLVTVLSLRRKPVLLNIPGITEWNFISGDTLEDKSSPAEAGNFEDGAAVAKLIFKIMLPEVADEVDIERTAMARPLS